MPGQRHLSSALEVEGKTMTSPHSFPFTSLRHALLVPPPRIWAVCIADEESVLWPLMSLGSLMPLTPCRQAG